MPQPEQAAYIPSQAAWPVSSEHTGVLHGHKGWDLRVSNEKAPRVATYSGGLSGYQHTSPIPLLPGALPHIYQN